MALIEIQAGCPTYPGIPGQLCHFFEYRYCIDCSSIFRVNFSLISIILAYRDRYTTTPRDLATLQQYGVLRSQSSFYHFGKTRFVMISATLFAITFCIDF